MNEAANCGGLSYQTGIANLTAAATALFILGGLVVAAFIFPGFYGWLLSGSVCRQRGRNHFNFFWLGFGRAATTSRHD
jgi:hypothetical protein